MSGLATGGGGIHLAAAIGDGMGGSGSVSATGAGADAGDDGPATADDIEVGGGGAIGFGAGDAGPIPVAAAGTDAGGDGAAHVTAEIATGGGVGGVDGVHIFGTDDVECWTATCDGLAAGVRGCACRGELLPAATIVASGAIASTATTLGGPAAGVGGAGAGVGESSQVCVLGVGGGWVCAAAFCANQTPVSGIR